MPSHQAFHSMRGSTQQPLHRLPNIDHDVRSSKLHHGPLVIAPTVATNHYQHTKLENDRDQLGVTIGSMLSLFLTSTVPPDLPSASDLCGEAFSDTSRATMSEEARAAVA